MRRTKSERDEAKARLILTIKKGTPMPLSMCLTEIVYLRADLEDAEQEIAAILDKFCGPNPYEENRWRDDVQPNPQASGNSEGI